MRLLKKLFGRGRAGRGKAPRTALRARELEATIAEAERLVAAGRHEEALRVAEQGLERFPAASRLRSVIQYIRRTTSHRRLAELRKVLEERKDERAYRELISLYIDLGKRQTALETATKYVEEFPDSSEAHATIAEVHVARYFTELFARDAWSAFEHLERSLELDSSTIRAHMLRALLYYSIGALRYASNELQAVVQIDPANARVAEFREELLAAAAPDGEEDIEILLDEAEDRQEIPNDPADFPGGRRFAVERRGGALSPKLFAAAAAGMGRRLRIEQLAAVATGGRPLAVAGENKENFVRLACRLDAASRRAGRHMNFGTMRRFMAEGKFGRIVLIPAGKCAVAARAPRSVSTERIAEGLETVVSASRAEEGEDV